MFGVRLSYHKKKLLAYYLLTYLLTHHRISGVFRGGGLRLPPPHSTDHNFL